MPQATRKGPCRKVELDKAPRPSLTISQGTTAPLIVIVATSAAAIGAVKATKIRSSFHSPPRT
ncbi:MAG: hypothetical protein HC938_14955 [Nitrospira sp.]|nr:hypothetical protein [Nitrospira sp.]